MDLSSFRLGSDRRLFTGARRFLSTATIAGHASGASGLVPGPRRTTDDAVVVALRAPSQKSTGGSTAQAATDLAAVTPEAPSSGIRSLLSDLTRITERITDLKGSLEKAPKGTAAAESLTQEIAGLNQEYQRILSSDSVSRLREVVEGVNQALQSGTSASAIADTLASDVGLLGRDFLARIRGGDIANIRSFSNSLATLSDLAATDLGADDTALALAKRAIGEAYQSLKGPTVTAPEIPSITRERPRAFAPLPVQVEVGFHAAGELALGLQTFIGEDAIQAALAHVPFDPSHALILTAPEPDEEKERLRRDEIERKKKVDEKLDRSQSVEAESAPKPEDPLPPGGTP